MPVALVLGANKGGIGGTVAAELLQRNWEVRALVRKQLDWPFDCPAPESIQGDAMNESDVMEAAKGVSVIIHAVNPPQYKNWNLYVLPMLKNSIKAAEANKARVVLPGTLYNFGPDALPLLNESSPQVPISQLGEIRTQMEKELEESSVDVLIVRSGDYFGPYAFSSFLSMVMITPGAPIKSIWQGGPTGVGHEWAYLPDLATTIVDLLTSAKKLERFARFHFKGHFDKDNTMMIQSIQSAVGKEVKVSMFPWWLIWLTSPFLNLARQSWSIRYLWTQTAELDNRKLVEFLGEEPHTPLDDAMRSTLRAFNCL